MSLGAQRQQVMRLVIGQGMKLAGAGLALGLIAAFVLARVLTSLLFGVSAHDPVTFAVVPLGLLAVSVLACYVPARRAIGVDPIIALRYE
jgi:putative ABC transport system permease protein